MKKLGRSVFYLNMQNIVQWLANNKYSLNVEGYKSKARVRVELREKRKQKKWKREREQLHIRAVQINWSCVKFGYPLDVYGIKISLYEQCQFLEQGSEKEILEINKK